MSKRERLELTFGEKDADLWQYIESFGLPKAPLIKKMIRDQMEQQTTVQPPIKVVAPVEKVEVTQPAKQITSQEEVATDPAPIKKPSMFGGLVEKR